MKKAVWNAGPEDIWSIAKILSVFCIWALVIRTQLRKEMEFRLEATGWVTRPKSTSRKSWARGGFQGGRVPGPGSASRT